MDSLSRETLVRLHKALEPLNRQYDPVVSMLREPFRSSGFLKFLRGLPVHPTRESLSYAAALFDTGDSRLYERAVKILRQVICLQDQRVESKTYGVWPKYLEEKPFKIVQPDQNWCNFLSQYLLQIVLYHRDRLPAQLLAEIDRAILHATHSIRRRNVPHEYTNIAVMGIYVTLVAAQIYDLSELQDYAIARLRDFHDFTFEQGGFSEFNSPTYTIVTLKVLGRLRLHIENVEAQTFIENLYRLAWEEIAYHFHPATRQWSGPHSRSYSTLLEADVLALIERSTAAPVNFGIAETHPSIDEHWLHLPCPPDLEHFFLPTDTPRTTTTTLRKKVPTQVLTTDVAPTFALGTVNYSDFWSQRRLLVAYWGAASQPGYLRLRCLHNGADFATAQFFSTQSEGRVLAGVAFAQDIHPVNPYIPNRPSDANRLTKDLRLRFELGGFLETVHFKIQPPPHIDPTSVVHLCVDDVHVQIRLPYVQFGQTKARWEVHQSDSVLYLDVVLWSGQQRAFALTELDHAAIAFALQITPEVMPMPAVQVQVYEHWLEMDWYHLKLKMMNRPAPQLILNTAVFPEA